MLDTVIYLIVGIIIGAGACAGVTIAMARKAKSLAADLTKLQLERNDLVRLANSLADQRNEWRRMAMLTKCNLSATTPKAPEAYKWPKALDV